MTLCIFLFTFSIFHFPFSIALGETWTLTTGDFQSRAVHLLALDQKGARVVGASGGDEQFIPMDHLLELSRAGAPIVPDDETLILETAGGDRLVGHPAGMVGENVVWKHPLLGDVSVAFRDARALRREGTKDSPTDATTEPPSQDVVWLVNGDSVRGIITDLGVDTLGIQVAQADQSALIELRSVSHVAFARVGQADNGAAPASPTYRLRLRDGSTITTRWAEVAGQQVRIALSDDAQDIRQIALDNVVAVEQRNGPVTWLCDLTPAVSEQQTFISGPHHWPARMDRSVTGQAIRFGSRTFTHGIGVHAYSRLSFDLPDGAYAALRTQYAIDAGVRSYANVTVRIKLDDDRIVHEQSSFGAGVISPVVLIELAGAKTLTLEVDYGQSHDVQDRFNWIEPALLRQMPRLVKVDAPTTTRQTP